MRVLPPRTYANDARARKRLFTPESVSHPAKMHTALCRDLFLRYTLPGQTVLDPFGGVGTSLLGAILPEPRNVWLVELEPKFVALAQANADRLRKRMLPGLPMGEMRIEQGNSRKLPFESAVECVVSSPPYANAISDASGGGFRTDWAERRAERLRLLGMPDKAATVLAKNATPASNFRQEAYGVTEGNIGNLPAGDISAILGSPPYADAITGDSDAQRQRKAERHARGEFKAVRPDVFTSTTNEGSKGIFGGYGQTEGNIGNLPTGDVSAVIGSPPYANCDVAPSESNRPEAKIERLLREGKTREAGVIRKHGSGRYSGLRSEEYGSTFGQIGNLPVGEVDSVIGSPPYAQAINQHPSADNLERRLERMEAAGIDTSKRVNVGGPNGSHRIRQNYSGVDSVIGSPPFGEMNSRDAGGTVTQRPNADGVGFEGGREAFVYSEATPGQIGNLPAGDVAAVISSPPYADVASRNRTAEPYSQAMDPELKRRYGHEQGNRHVDGYGETAGQIGALPHAVVTSPPWSDSVPNPAGSDAFREPAQLNGRGGGNIVPGFYSEYGGSDGQIGAEHGETYASACLAVYRECYRVVRPGGVLVLVTGNYVRDGQIIDLAADTITLAQAAGWTPIERWRHEKAGVSFWRRLHHKQGRPIVTHEDVLVFVKQYQGWEFAELSPTTMAPAKLEAGKQKQLPRMEAFA